jgi:hypothetical protein
MERGSKTAQDGSGKSLSTLERGFRAEVGHKSFF